MTKNAEFQEQLLDFIFKAYPDVYKDTKSNVDACVGLANTLGCIMAYILMKEINFDTCLSNVTKYIHDAAHEVHEKAQNAKKPH